jgi:enoyl-CoA hydratase/carnithine racemase
MATLRREADVFVLDLGDGENRFTLDAVSEISDALAEVASASGPKALVTTARGKIFSNGLDLEWVLEEPEKVRGYVMGVQQLMIDVLIIPAPTAAAIGGHAFAAGAMLSLAHDTRIMRADRGFFCLPEVDLGLPFTWGMSELIQARLTPQVAHEAMVTGRRYGGAEAAEAGIVEHAVAAEDVLVEAMAWAERLAPKAGQAMGAIKARMYAGVVAQLGAMGAG